MKLEDIVVSLELAKDLKEAGYPQDSLNWWNFYSPGAMDEEYVRVAYGRYKLENIELDNEESLSAPTASELLERLPTFIKIDKEAHWLSCSVIKSNDEGTKAEIWWTQYQGLGFEYTTRGDTLVQSIAKMWLYLKQNNLINKER